jgi:hypothetical protein
MVKMVDIRLVRNNCLYPGKSFRIVVSPSPGGEGDQGGEVNGLFDLTPEACILANQLGS